MKGVKKDRMNLVYYFGMNGLNMHIRSKAYSEYNGFSTHNVSHLMMDFERSMMKKFVNAIRQGTL